MLSASWPTLPASQLPAGHRQSSHSRRSRAEAGWQRGAEQPLPSSPAFFFPCLPPAPAGACGVASASPGWRGMPWSVVNPLPSAAFLFGARWKVPLLVKRRGAERGNQIRGFLRVKNPGMLHKPELLIPKTRHSGSRLLIGSGRNSSAASTQKSLLCHKLPAEPPRQSSPASFFPLRKRSCFTSCYGCA